MDAQRIKLSVKDHYGQIAQQSTCSCGPACCAADNAEVIPLVDYGEFRLDVMQEADLGLGCGTPTRFTQLSPGEVVLDLGSGAGIDVFLAARQIGPTGRAIGVDMTPEMIARAIENARRGGYTNVEFRLGEIENLPVETGSVDVVISNCVINLVPDKSQAFAEIFRVLKPGGRFVISDIVTFGEIPDAIRRDMELWAGCIAGAIDQDRYMEIVRQTGFNSLDVLQLVKYDGYQAENFGLASMTLAVVKV